MTSIEQQRISKIRQWLEDVLFDLLNELTFEKAMKEVGIKAGRSSLLPNLESAYKNTEKAIDEIDELI